MKAASAVFWTGGGVVVASTVLGVEAVIAYTLLQGGIGAETPIDGLTLGAVLVGLLAIAAVSLRAVVFGLREGWAITRSIVKVLDEVARVDPIAKQVRDHETRLQVLEAEDDRVRPLTQLAERLATRQGELRAETDAG